MLTNLWKVKQVKRAHALTTSCTKLWKTPALTTSSAACRKYQTSIMALYLAAHWRPAMHYSCLPSSSNANTNNTCQSVGAHKRLSYMCLKGNYPSTPVPKTGKQTEHCNPLQVNRPSDKVTNTFHPQVEIRPMCHKAHAAWWLQNQGIVLTLLPLLSSPHRYILLNAGIWRGNYLFFLPDLGIHVKENLFFARKHQGWSRLA